ncbi:MAG TPA: glycosyltransferase [Patescibacteria group bacterium]|nr:glycosyltransferase [Patescibacteria group bacterium]
MHKNLKLTIGIPAYNEESNIVNILKSILKQKEKGFEIEKILVISDGSTDGTVSIVKSIKDKRITVFDNSKRVGKSELLNVLFRKSTSEILVLFDADVVMKSANILEYLIRPFINDKNVGLTGGNPVPIPGKTFVERSINSSFVPYKELQVKFKGGNNVYGCQGSILALSKKLYKKIQIPPKMIGNDSYIYYSCLINGFKFVHVHEAVVWYRSPSNISDHLKQNKRFLAAQYRLKRVFGDIVEREHHVPPVLLYRLLAIQFIKMPIHSAFIFFVNKAINNRAKSDEKKMTAIWDVAVSTKEAVRNVK